MTMSPGTSASTLIVAEDANVDADNVTVTAEDTEGLTVEGPDTLHEGDNGTIGGWITANASDDAIGEHNVTVTLENDGDSYEGSVSITVEEASEPLEEGATAQANFSALTQGEELAFTNDMTVANAPTPKADGYQEPRQSGPSSIPLALQGGPMDDLIEAIIGTGENHTVNADIPEAFGPEVQEQSQPREETIDRETQVPSEIELPRQQANQLLPQDAEEGDEVDFPVTRDQALPYEIVNLTEENVNLVLALEEGDTVTTYEVWPDATNVTHVGEEQATLRTTPTHEEGETFTWNENWGPTTEVVEINETEIVLRHSPEVGTSYTETNPQTQEQVTVTVAEVNETEIVIERENPHPLAGETLTFVVTVEGEAPPQPQPRQPR